MPSWSHINAGDFVPPPLKPLVSTAKSVSNALSSLLSLIEKILDIVRLFIVEVVDPQRALVNALIEKILALINDLRQSGLYILVNKPNHVEDAKSVDAHLQEIADALYDPYDPNRPELSKLNSAYTVVLMICSPSGLEFGRSLDLMGRVFNIDDFKQAAEDFKKHGDTTIDDIDIPNPGGGSKPDFVAIRPEKIFPPLALVFHALEQFAKMIEPGIPASQAFAGMLDAIEAKVNELRDVAESLQRDLDDFISNASQLGLYILKGTVGGGNDGIANVVQNSGGQPTLNNAYIASITLIATPDIAGTMDLFF